MIAPVSDGVNWLVAACIALLAHVAGLLWIEQDRPRGVVELDRISDHIVVMLDPGSAAVMQTAPVVDEPQERVDQLPAPARDAGSVREVDDAPPVSPERLDIAPGVADPDSAPSIAAHAARAAAQTHQPVAPLATIDEAHAKLAHKAAEPVRSITPATLVEHSNQAAAVDTEIDGAPTNLRYDTAEAIQSIATVVSAVQSNQTTTIDPTPEAIQSIATVISAVRSNQTTTIDPVEIEPGGSVATAVAVASPTVSRSVPEVQDLPAPVGLIPSSSVPEATAVDPESKPPIEAKATTPVAPVTVSPDSPAPEVPPPDPQVWKPGELALSNPIQVQVESSEPVVDVDSAADIDLAQPAPVIQIKQYGRDASVVDLVLEVTAVETARVTEQGVSIDTPGPQEVKVVEVPAEQQVAVFTLDELERRSAGGRGVVAGYAGRLKGWLQENLHYPRAARLAGIEGKAVVRFAIDREGMVLSIQLEQESGQRILDREAMEMIERANPFPAMPAEMTGAELNLRVPIVFKITDVSKIKQIPPINLQ